MLLGSDPIELEALPFEHFTGHGKLPATGTELLDWLETEAPWELTRTEFYEQYEFSLAHCPPAPVLRPVVCAEALTALRDRMSACFGRSLSGRVDVTAHKLVPGKPFASTMTTSPAARPTDSSSSSIEAGSPGTEGT